MAGSAQQWEHLANEACKDARQWKRAARQLEKSNTALLNALIELEHASAMHAFIDGKETQGKGALFKAQCKALELLNELGVK